MTNSQLKTDGIATVLEEILQLSAELGVRGTILFGGISVAYLAVGTLITTAGFQLPYPFLSIEADPVFVIDSAITGLFIMYGAGSLLLYQFLTGISDESVPSVLRGFIALGVGGGLVRMTLPEAWTFLISYI